MEKQATADERQTGAERILSLHSRLYQEAQKIRKWKIETEVDLKHKVLFFEVKMKIIVIL